MKIVFDDKSYIDIHKSDHPDKVVVVISSKDGSNPLKKITNSVEVTMEEFKKLISDAL